MDPGIIPGSVKDMHQLTEKLVKKKELTDEEVKRYEAYRKDKNLASMRQQMEVELRNADAEQLTSARIAEEKTAAQRQAEQNRLKHRDPEPGSLPAVASSKAPVGVDSSSAAEVLEDLANYFNTPEVKEVMDDAKEAKRVETREAQIALIRQARPEMTDYEAQELRNLYDQKTAGAVAVKSVIGAGELIKETGRRIADDIKTTRAEHEATKDKYLPARGTMERSLADCALSGYTDMVMMAATAGSVYEHTVAPVVNVVVDAGAEVLKGVTKGMALRDAGLANAAYQFGGDPKPTFTPDQQLEHVDQAFEGMGKAVETVVKPVVETVQSSLEFATGSKRAAEVLTEPVLMVATEGASRLIKPAFTAAKSGVKAAANAVRNLEVTVDSTALLRHNAGIPFDAIKVGQKAPKVEVPHNVPEVTSTAAPKVENPTPTATVSEAPLSLPKYESGRNVPGQAMMSFELTNPPVLLRGSHNNVAKVPLEVAQKMSGKEFKTFDEFREAFWKTMAESSYAKEFKPADIARMCKGNAPIAHLDQSLGSRVSYELHHMTPIHDGGAVYDMSNILIVTPKYHKEILSKHTHYGVQ